MSAALQLAALGVASGALYALSALGVLVVYRSSGVLNLANGAFAMVAGYTLWSVNDSLGLPSAVAVLAAIALSCLVSVAVFFGVMRPLARASTLTRLVATLAVYIIVQSIVQVVFGPFNRVPSSFLPTNPVRLLGVTIGMDQLITVLVAVVITACLWLVYRYTRFGMATTAVSENPRALAALGRDVDVLRAANWLVAGFVGGVAGVFIAPITQLTPGSFLLFLVPSLAAAVLGAMRSFPVTLIAGMATGAVQVLSARYIQIPGVGAAIPFVIIILVLVLLGRSLPGRAFVSERLPRVGSGQVYPARVVLVVAVVLVLAYTVFDDSLVLGSIVLVAAATVALSQVVVTGYAGQLSLAQTTMAGVGGLVAAWASARMHAPFIVALLIGAVAVIPVGILVGLPAIRARGTTLAIATLGFGVAVDGLILTNTDINGGVTGLAVGSPSFLGIDLNAVLNPRNYFVFALVLFVLIALAVANLRRGRAGRRLLAVRTNERAAAALGINVSAAKLYAFTLAAVIASVGGTLVLFSNPTVIVNTGFDVFTSVSAVAFAVLGGIGYIGGALVGGSFNSAALPGVAIGNLFGALNFQQTLNTWLPLIGGVLLLVQLLIHPAGIVDAIVHPRRRPGRTGQAAAAGATSPGGPGGRGSRLALLMGGRRAVAAAQESRMIRELAVARSLPRQLRGAALAVRGVTVRYGSVTAVDDVSFEVAAGEVLSIIGPNGAGKTSLMDGVTGFCPMTGSVELAGSPIGSWPAHRRARAGLVRSFQTLELLEDMTVLDNLRTAGDKQDLRSYLLDLVHPARGGLSAAAEAAVSAFHLEQMLTSVPTDLAYGDRRLVAIARAVAAEPSVLLLDEPAAGLSEKERVEVGDLIRLIAKDWKIAVLLIEHDVDLVRRVSDRVVALDFGKSIAAGTPQEVLTHPQVVEAYLGHAGSDPAPSVPEPQGGMNARSAAGRSESHATTSEETR